MLTTQKRSAQPRNGLTIHAYLLASLRAVCRPIVFDVCYIPKWTVLLQQARDAQCCTVHGLDMLIHQGIEQARMWCHTPAVPAGEITRRVKHKYDPDATPTSTPSEHASSSDAAAEEAKRIVAEQLKRGVAEPVEGASAGAKAPPTDILNVITAQRRLDVAASKQQQSLEDLKAELERRVAASTVCG